MKCSVSGMFGGSRMSHPWDILVSGGLIHPITTHTRVGMNHGSLSKPFRGHKSYVPLKGFLYADRYMEFPAFRPIQGRVF